MKLSVERQEASIVVLDIAADEDEFATSMDRAFRRVSRDIQIPGFRKGKAPRNMVERFYGREVFLREAADELMDKLYREALEQAEITPVGEPEVEIVELEPVAFKVSVPVYPTIEPGDYASVRVDLRRGDHRGRCRRGSSAAEVAGRGTGSEGGRSRATASRSTTRSRKATRSSRSRSDAQFVLGETNLSEQLREDREMKVARQNRSTWCSMKRMRPPIRRSAASRSATP